MFNKTLHRPMFRKGGSTGSAGTLVLRPAYKHQDKVMMVMMVVL